MAIYVGFYIYQADKSILIKLHPIELFCFSIEKGVQYRFKGTLEKSSNVPYHIIPGNRGAELLCHGRTRIYLE